MKGISKDIGVLRVFHKAKPQEFGVPGLQWSLEHSSPKHPQGGGVKDPGTPEGSLCPL